MKLSHLSLKIFYFNKKLFLINETIKKSILTGEGIVKELIEIEKVTLEMKINTRSISLQKLPI